MQRVSVSLAAVAVVALAGGCTADSGDEGMFVLKNVRAAAGCMVTPADNESGIPSGSLDLFLPSSYIFIAQVRSRITALAGQEDQRTVIITGANIDITFPGSTLFSDTELADLKTSALTHFKQPFSAPLGPNGGLTDVGFSLIPEPLIERIVTKALPVITANPPQRFRLESLATFTIVGDMSGATVTSQPFSYPVTIGNGVSVVIAGSCPLPQAFGMPRTGYSCNPGQDGVIDCCTTATPQGLALTCPATLATM